MQALPRPPDVPQDSARLRLNRLLNMSGRSGRASGNALGALGLFFSSFESSIGYFSDGRTPDSLNTIAAGHPHLQLLITACVHACMLLGSCAPAL